MPMSIDWTKVDSKITAVAMDADGSVYGYGEMPKIDGKVGNRRAWIGYSYFRMSSFEFPASALLTPYHPRDWEDSLTLRPATYTRAQYKAMAAMEQFGVFWDGEGKVNVGTVGKLNEVSFVDESPFRFYRAEGSWWDHFLPLRPLQPIPPEEVEG